MSRTASGKKERLRRRSNLQRATSGTKNGKERAETMSNKNQLMNRSAPKTKPQSNENLSLFGI